MKLYKDDICLVHISFPFHSYCQYLNAWPHYLTFGFLCFSASSLSPLHLNLNIPARLIFRNTPAHMIPCSEISEGFLLLEKNKKQKPECLHWQWRGPASWPNITAHYHLKTQLKFHLHTNSSIIGLGYNNLGQQKYNASNKCTFKFFIATVKSFPDEINFNIFYLT